MLRYRSDMSFNELFARLPDTPRSPMGWRLRPRDDAMGTLRRLGRARFMERHPSAPRGVVTLLLTLLWWPARGAWLAARFTRRFAAKAREVTDDEAPAPGTQFLQQWGYALLLGIHPREYYALELFRPANRRRLASFLYRFESSAYHGSPPDDTRAIVNDKEAFTHFCARHGLPTIPLLGRLDGGEGAAGREWITTRAASGAASGALLLKPAAGRAGHGIFRFSAGDHPRKLERCAGSAYLVQPFLANHPELVALGGAGGASVRVVTLLDPDSGVASCLAATFQAPREGRCTSNLGVHALIDLETGVLGRGRLLAALSPRFTHHPDRGAPLEGVTLPCWSATRELALRAHRELGAYPSLAWDLLITPEGPRLLEANESWDFTALQSALGEPLGETPLPETAVRWLRAAP